MPYFSIAYPDPIRFYFYMVYLYMGLLLLMTMAIIKYRTYQNIMMSISNSKCMNVQEVMILKPLEISQILEIRLNMSLSLERPGSDLRVLKSQLLR
jgi:hypothetical protein